MGFRFFKRLRIAPGVTVNFSKRGASVSFGPRGAKVTVGGRHGTRVTAGIPGTGLFYTETPGSRSASRGSGSTAEVARPAPHIPPGDRLTMGFFRRLITPPEEEALVDGMRELTRDNRQEALRYFQGAAHLADGAFLTGLTALNLGDLREAAVGLKLAAADHRRLGQYFEKYGVSPVVSIPITPQIAAVIEPDLRGVLLALVEVHQHLGEVNEAMTCLKRLMRPVVVRADIR